MRFSIKIQNVLLELICLLYVLLFVYASVSKLLDFENFQIQLGQSPMLSAFTGWVSWGVIIIELVTACLLAFYKTRLLGLYISFVLMTMFTTYIYIILNFSAFIPCSCGGVLEKLNWTQHLIFNICFIGIAILGVLIFNNTMKTACIHLKKRCIKLIVLFLLSVVIVVLLFIASEDIIYKRNNFVRRFPQHPVVLKHQLDLKHNTYFIAGMDKNYIYLSNDNALLHIKVLNTKLDITEENGLTVTNLDLPFRALTLQVFPPNFYFMDGYVPVIFSGKVSGWKAEEEHPSKAFFSLIASIDSTSFAIRARDSETKEDVLGILKIGDSSSVQLSRDLLKKQVDGVFDTDGSLIYNQQLERIIYTYFYRNQFVVVDKGLQLDYVGKTIDTISQAQIKVQYISPEKGSKFSEPPLIVNKKTATYGNYLFVHSNLMGRFENKETWKKSSVIDVYDLVSNTYVLSFYIPNIGRDNMFDFYLFEDVLVCLVGNYIQVYKLDPHYFEGIIFEN